MKKSLLEIEEKFRKNLASIRQELSEHLSAINENTGELQSFFDYLQEIEQKLDKLSQRLDQLQLQSNFPKEKPYIAPLNTTEKKLFLTFYTEGNPLSCLELSQKSGVPLSIIREFLTSLSQKGIPLTRAFLNNQTCYQIDPQFKEWQAKENIINLSLDSFFPSEKNPPKNIQTKLKTYCPKLFEQ